MPGYLVIDISPAWIMDSWMMTFNQMFYFLAKCHSKSKRTMNTIKGIRTAKGYPEKFHQVPQRLYQNTMKIL